MACLDWDNPSDKAIVNNSRDNYSPEICVLITLDSCSSVVDPRPRLHRPTPGVKVLTLIDPTGRGTLLSELKLDRLFTLILPDRNCYWAFY